MDQQVFEACTTASRNTNYLVWFIVIALLVVVVAMIMMNQRTCDENRRLQDRVRALHHQSSDIQRSIESKQQPAPAIRMEGVHPQPRSAYKDPNSDAPRSHTLPHNGTGESIWDAPMPDDPFGPQSIASGPRRLGSLIDGNTNLWSRQRDHLDEKDIDVPRDAFPARADRAPEDGHEAIMQKYNFEQFRNAWDRMGSSYLRPILTRDGSSRYGMRTDRASWDNGVRQIQEQIAELGEDAYDLMIPLPDHFFDPVRPEKWETQLSGRRQLVQKHPQHLHDRGTQNISTSDAGLASRQMEEMISAIREANKGAGAGSARIHPTSQQLRALSHWVVSGNAAASSKARAIADELRLPLPPAPTAAQLQNQ
jgi:hypothetical protein